MIACTRHLQNAAMAALELGHVSLADALALTLLALELDDERAPRLAARWLGRFIVESSTSASRPDARIIIRVSQVLVLPPLSPPDPGRCGPRRRSRHRRRLGVLATIRLRAGPRLVSACAFLLIRD